MQQFYTSDRVGKWKGNEKIPMPYKDPKEKLSPTEKDKNIKSRNYTSPKGEDLM